MKRALIPEQVNEAITSSPFHRLLGLELHEATDELLTLRLPFQESFVAGDHVDYIHGGIIATIIDVAGYYTLFQVLNLPAPTIDLRIDYLRAAKSGDELFATATIVKLGRSVSSADIVVVNQDNKKLAVGRGLYSTNQSSK